MKLISLLRLSTLLLFSLLISGDLQAQWRAGSAVADITPAHPMWMAGYASRSAPADGATTPLYAKALVLEDASGTRAVLLTLDLIGIDRASSEALCEQLKAAYGLERQQIAICTSHTHSGPVVGKVLEPMHLFSLSEEHQKLVETYTTQLLLDVKALVGTAIQAMEPVRVQHGSGQATFAVNRRNNVEAEVLKMREKGRLVGPVDHDVPVLTVRREDDSLMTVVFGYACHATVLSFQQWNADYAGYAQSEIEGLFPQAVAMFWAGCGGDQNPLPRRELKLAEHYGKELAMSVKRVLDAPMEELEPKLKLEWRVIEAPYAEPMSKEQLLKEHETPINRFELARAKYLLRQLEKEGGFPKHYPYPVGNWVLGDRVDFVFLGGEVVIDYALRLKENRWGKNTWVAGYSNDVMAYIPSKRVLEEGGYEGGASNLYYGLPALWHESIEKTILEAVPALE